MKTAALAAIFVLMTLTAPVHAQNCERECAKRPHSVRCGACGEISKSVEKKMEKGFAPTPTSQLHDEDIAKLTPQELEAWKKEYGRRRNSMESKCNSVKKDDPNYDTINDHCRDNLALLSNKIAAINEEMKKGKDAQAHAQRCRQPKEQLSDDQYCNECGLPCTVGGMPPKLTPDWKLNASREPKRREKPEKKSKGPKKGPSVSVEGCLQAKCAGACSSSNKIPGNCETCRKINASICRGQQEMQQGTLNY